jgi:cobalt-zinc-cadmium resistance protein CzcA
LIKRILEFGLTRRAIVVIGIFIFLGLGIAAFLKLNIEAYPNPAPVIIEITAQAPGVSAEEMERYYTIPLETALYPVPKVSNIRSTSFYGLTWVQVTFAYGTDYYFAYAQTALALQQNVSLPNNVAPIIQQSALVGEVYRYQITGPRDFGLTNLRTVQDWIVARRLMTIPGVVQINTLGGTTKQFSVEADLQKLDNYNVTIGQIVAALANANINVGGREIQLGQQSVNIRGIGQIDDGGADNLLNGYNTQDIENIVLTQNKGAPVQIKNVARVSVSYKPRLGVLGRDHEDDVVTAIVVMGRLQHTNEILPRIEAKINEMNADGTLPDGVKLVPFYDRGILVGVTTHTVIHNLVFGCLLVFFIQWIFLGDLRSALIVGSNIPFALLFAIILLVSQGEDANLLSVGAVDFGIIVDSAVILVENIFRNFQASRTERVQLLQYLAEGIWGPDPTSAASSQGSARRWSDRLRLIYISTLQVDRAVFFTAAITVTAFIPLFTMTGVEGQIFGPMARTYAYALAGALLATFTVTPVLASLVLPEKVEEVETFFVRYLREAYTPVLKWALANNYKALLFGVSFIFLSVFCASRLGTEFLPTLEEGNFWIRATLPPTLSLESGLASTRKIREILLKHPEIRTVISQLGRPDNGSDAQAFSNIQIFAPLKPFDEWPAGLTKEALTAQLQTELRDELPGVIFSFSQYIKDNIETAISGVNGGNAAKIVGPDLATLEKIAKQVREQLSATEGVTDLEILHTLGQPNLNIKIDRAKIARYGINTGDVTTLVEAAIAGVAATRVFEGDRQFDVVVRLMPEYRQTLERISNVKVAYTPPGSATNSYIPLRELATISLDTGASFIYREASRRNLPVKFNVRGRDLGSTIAEAQRRVRATVELPKGYEILWVGEFDNMVKANQRLSVVAPITLVAIFALLYGLFSSVRDTLIALAGIPFAVSGGIVSLYLSGLDFSVSAAIGFISLFGVAVMDGILNITYIRELMLQGRPFSEAVYFGAEQRMRPMLMTALSAGVGLLPAAFSHGIGSQVQRPLATVVVGGMLIGPIMLLVVAPVLRKMFIMPYTQETGSMESEQ